MSTSSNPPKNDEEKDLLAEAEFLKIDAAMIDLFRMELETQSQVMNDGLVAIEMSGGSVEQIEPLMRAAHSIKGAGRVVRLEPVVALSHLMEECFVSVQKTKITLTAELVDLLLQAIDIFTKLAKLPQQAMIGWLKQEAPIMAKMQDALMMILSGTAPPSPPPSTQEAPKQQAPLSVPVPVQEAPVVIDVPPTPPAPPTPVPSTPPASSLPPEPSPVKVEISPAVEKKDQRVERVLRVTAQNLNRLMGLAGESMVESRWLQPFSDSLLQLKKEQNDLSFHLEQIRAHTEKKSISERAESELTMLQDKVDDCRQGLTDRMTDLELFIVRHSSLSDRLYREVIDSRMRPFSDGVEGFPRMVRDLSRRLNKKVHLHIVGKNTQVDREILEKLEAPLGHLIRNSIDHGIESPEERVVLGKPQEGTITLEAEHRAGMLAITVRDDGRGINLEQVRRKIVEQKLISPEMVNSLTEAEILDFLFLPGFSTAKDVTDISGRGVGLNVVQTMVQDVAGVLRITQAPKQGTTFHLQLPLTLSVIRAIIVEISKETFAFPLARIDSSHMVKKDEIEVIENREYFNFHGKNIGLVLAAQVMELDELKYSSDFLPVIVLSDHTNTYGLVVDRFLGERELVVQELDPRLGKVQDINSGALLEDGSPVLIIDVEDLVRSVDNLLSGGRIHQWEYGKEEVLTTSKKRILVVDDSITVREVECRLLRNHGYEVETAINGMDGWNAVRIGKYDLVVSDVDMPRMNGIELVKAIRADARLKTMPVLIVSYKERDEDRQRGLDAGANYYLTKSSFHDETLINVVQELIGTP